MTIQGRISGLQVNHSGKKFTPPQAAGYLNKYFDAHIAASCGEL